MTEEPETREDCDCEEHEREERRTIRIEIGRGKTLNVTEIQRVAQMHEVVNEKQVTTPFGRSYEQLVELGPGLHSICDCKSIGPKGAVSKFRRD